jgi:hypothetical protein
MISFKSFITEASLSDLENHISKLAKDLKLSKPIEKNSYFKSISYNTDMDVQKIFDILKSKGYYKMKGYDPKPDTWTTSRDHENMSFRTDKIFFRDKSNLFMVNLYGEHGSKTKITFSIQ